MKLWILTALLASASALFGKETSNRIVTIEYWRGRSAQVWCVEGSSVRQYELHDNGAPSKTNAEHQSDGGKLDLLRRAVAAIPGNLRGRIYFNREQDGLMLRISFSSDGSLREDRIELQNVWLPELASLINALNATVPSGARVTFPRDVEEHARGDARNREYYSKTIREYYGL